MKMEKEAQVGASAAVGVEMGSLILMLPLLLFLSVSGLDGDPIAQYLGYLRSGAGELAQVQTCRLGAPRRDVLKGLT